MTVKEALIDELTDRLDEVLHPFMQAHPEMTAEDAREALYDLGNLADLWAVWRDRDARQRWTAEGPGVIVQ
jgi:hypothetical protein